MEPGQLVWLITGTSSGFGRVLVDIALARGDRVLATVRSLADAPVAPPAHAAALHVLQLDVSTPAETIKAAIDAAAAVWGQIDVLVNNAGYVYGSLLEEASPEGWAASFQVNTFSAIAITNAVLPHMRARRSGTVVMMGSRSAWAAQMPYLGFYAAAKAALHALGETYAAELRPLGIRVCIVAPGAFRTENMEKMRLQDGRDIADYDRIRHIKDIATTAGRNFKGDPRKAMELLVDAVRGEGKAKGKQLPMYLPMGGVTYDKLRDYCKQMTDGMDEWESIARDLNLEEVPSS